VGPNITPDLDVSIRPRGVITIRELRRRQLVDLDLGTLYCRQLLQEARNRR
jgi:CBS domain-containing protein